MYRNHAVSFWLVTWHQKIHQIVVMK